jgi:2,3-bisphosphoglycerate-dependent phosphoglycerate mutase
MRCHIYIFRHGQTYFNRDHRFTGWLDSALTPQGYKDADKIADRLKARRIDVAFCTSTRRSKDTLKEVLRYHPECKTIIINDDMIERSYGKLSGKHHSAFVHGVGEEYYKTLLHWHKIDHLRGAEHKRFVKSLGEAELKVIRRSYDAVPPGGESVRMVERRVLRFIRELINFIKREKVNVAISAHGNSMRPFRRYFERLTISEMMALENPWDDYFEYVVDVPEKAWKKKTKITK